MMRVPVDSVLVGKTLAESRIGASTDLIIMALVRFGRSETLPSRQTVLRAGDQLLVQGRLDQFIAGQQLHFREIIEFIQLRDLFHLALNEDLIRGTNGYLQVMPPDRTSAPRGMATKSGGPAASMCPSETMMTASKMGGTPVPFQSVPPAYTTLPAPESHAVVVTNSTYANATTRLSINERRVIHRPGGPVDCVGV